MPGTRTATVTPTRRRLIFVNIILSCIASSLLSTALSTALTPIINEFGVEVAVGQWITSIYSLVMAVMIPMTAFLAKRVHTKTLYAGVIAVFLVGTVACMLAPNIQILLVGRALQAMGAGAITTVGQMVLLTIFPVEERGTIMGWYGLALGAAPVVAPTLGGMLADSAGWRSIFALVFAIMLLSFIYALIVFSNVLENTKERFDILSFLLTAIVFGGVTYGIGVLAEGFDVIGCIALVVGALTCVLFVRRQLHLDKPFLDVRVFSSYRFRVATIASILLYLVMIGPVTTIPMVVQTGLGGSATVSGLVLLPGSLCSIVMNPIAGRLFDKIGARGLTIVGSALSLIPMVLLAFTTTGTPLALIAVYNAIRCIGIALMMMPLLTWAMSGLRQSQTADGTALFNALNQVASAISTAVFVGLMGDADVAGFDLSTWAGAGCAVVMLIVSVLFIRYRPGTVAAGNE